jgi:hypothetical protein
MYYRDAGMQGIYSWKIGQGVPEKIIDLEPTYVTTRLYWRNGNTARRP